MSNITHEEFCKVREAVLVTADDETNEEWYDTDSGLLAHLLARVEAAMFANYLAEKKDREMLADLIAKYGVPK